ncbi:MAG: ATP:cob(I)alamin adenosyltransferase [Phycisphaerae bacterium]
MPIYTRKGDGGFAHRPGGRQIRKTDPTFEALGTVDELNAHIGWCIHAAESIANCELRIAKSSGPDETRCAPQSSGKGNSQFAVRNSQLDVAAIRRILEALLPVQDELLTIGPIMAAAGTDKDPGVSVDDTAVARMERQIDAAWDSMPELTHFVAPRGSELCCRLHIARTVCRRAERRVVALADSGVELPPAVLKHLNRLSDLLFTLARLADHAEGGRNHVWKPKS